MHASDVERLRGQWVALAIGDETLVASAETFEDLSALLRSNEHQPVLVRRIPMLDEPLFLGGALELRLL
jgi:hypothetical protein